MIGVLAQLGMSSIVFPSPPTKLAKSRYVSTAGPIESNDATRLLSMSNVSAIQRENMKSRLRIIMNNITKNVVSKRIENDGRLKISQGMSIWKSEPVFDAAFVFCRRKKRWEDETRRKTCEQTSSPNQEYSTSTMETDQQSRLSRAVDRAKGHACDHESLHRHTHLCDEKLENICAVHLSVLISLGCFKWTLNQLTIWDAMKKARVKRTPNAAVPAWTAQSLPCCFCRTPFLLGRSCSGKAAKST